MKDLVEKEEELKNKEQQIQLKIKEVNERSLTHYIDTLIDKGYTKEQIKSKLVEAGWSEEHLRDVI